MSDNTTTSTESPTVYTPTTTINSLNNNNNDEFFLESTPSAENEDFVSQGWGIFVIIVFFFIIVYCVYTILLFYWKWKDKQAVKRHYASKRFPEKSQKRIQNFSPQQVMYSKRYPGLNHVQEPRRFCEQVQNHDRVTIKRFSVPNEPSYLRRDSFTPRHHPHSRHMTNQILGATIPLPVNTGNDLRDLFDEKLESEMMYTDNPSIFAHSFTPTEITQVPTEMSYRRPDLNYSKRYPYAHSEYTESTITSRPEGKSKSSASKEGNGTEVRRLNTLETDLESTFL